MRVLYLSTVCSQSRFDKLVEQGRIDSQFQNQKFHHLILDGLVASGLKDIFVISYYPVLEKSIVRFASESETVDGVNYVYPSFTNKPLDGFLSRIIAVYKCLKVLRTDDTVIICNIMNYEACIAARVFRFIYKTKIIAITADVPGIVIEKKRRNRSYPFVKKMLISPYLAIKNRLCLGGTTKYDAYVFLTEAMNVIVNPHHKPFIVMEGLADVNSCQSKNLLENKYKKRTVVYAGGLKKEYGIENLVKAFHHLSDSNLELHLYGYGSFVSELEEYCKCDSRIKYLGVKSNQEITEVLLKAHILINPRPTNQEFVKYSFPSKIMECMASGTPLMTTPIPGMPKDYYPHVYLIEDETEEGVYQALKSVLQLEDTVLQEKGRNAQKFIINNKNNNIQANRILTFVRSIIE